MNETIKIPESVKRSNTPALPIAGVGHCALSEAFNMDCAEGLRLYPDNYFDLAIVDPPYGIGQNWTKDKYSKFYNHRNDFNNSIPGQEYFYELFRVSKNQIIWGANYYWNFLRPSNNLIFWDKGKDAMKQLGSAGEIAWTNITKYPLVKVDLMWNGCCVCEKTEKVHPHQKPIKLYDWCLEYFSEPGWKILDTHLGSGSSRIAANKAGLDFTGFELDEEYFKAQEKRWQNWVSQTRLF